MKRIQTIDALRGIAAFSVCWFHFTNSNPSFLSNGFIKLSGSYGHLGVAIFFVISGYVLCHSLMKSNYTLTSFPSFIFKRLVRLEPPYLVSIILVLFLNYLSEQSSLYSGQTQQFDLARICSHIGYLSDILGYRWLNPVYWTLGIELQFYIFLGCIFPIFYFKQNLLSACILFLILVGFMISSEKFIFHYLPSFLMGIIFCLFAKKKLKKIHIFIFSSIIFYFVLHYGEGFLYAVIILTTSLLIFWEPIGKISILKHLGKISYSLYLIHIPIGGRIINLCARYTNDNYILQIFVLIAALIFSVFAAYILYFLVEKPSIKLTSKFNI